MEVKRLIKVLWRRKWLFLLTLLAVLASTSAFTYNQVPTYETRVRLIVSPSSVLIPDPNDLRSAVTALSAPVVANTYAEISQSSSIIEKAWQQLNSAPLEEYQVNSTVVPETTIVLITVSGPNPKVIQVLANAVTDQTIKYVEGLTTVYDLTLLDSANVPALPSTPNYQLNLALAIVIGLMAGVLFALLAEYLSAPGVEKVNAEPVIVRRYYEVPHDPSG